MVVEGEQRLDDPSVGLVRLVDVGVVDQHHHCLGAVERDAGQVVERQRAARADHDLDPVLVDDLVTQVLLHRHLVALGETTTMIFLSA